MLIFDYFICYQALFIAHGPDLKRGVEIESFQNIELYNLMSHLLGVTPAPNNGTFGALHNMLVQAPKMKEPRLVSSRGKLSCVKIIKFKTGIFFYLSQSCIKC